MRKDARPRSAIATVRAVGKSMANALKTLTEETENLIVKVDELEKTRAKTARKSKHRAAAKVRAKRKARVKKPPARKDDKIRGIIFRACKTGKIKRVSRGVYIAA
jgi:hypothetical protein